MFLERGRDARRPLQRRQLPGGLLLADLDPALDIANGIEVLGNFSPIVRTESPENAGRRLAYRVENAVVPPEYGSPLCGIRAPGVAKQALEHFARIVFHGCRGRGSPPRQRIDVGATPALFASA